MATNLLVYKNIEIKMQSKTVLENTDELFFDFTQKQYKNIQIFNVKNIDLNKPLGLIALYNIDMLNKTAGLEYDNNIENIEFDTRRDIVNCILIHAFMRLDMGKVYINIVKECYCKDQFFQKMNFLCEGILRSHYYYENKPHDIIFSSILRHEWVRRMNEL